MATIKKYRRIANPGRVRGRKRNFSLRGALSSAKRKAYSLLPKGWGGRAHRKPNVGSILTISIPGNPGRVKKGYKMARKRKVSRRRRRSVARRRVTRRANPIRRRRRVYAVRRRRAYGRRRNPAFLTGGTGKIVGVLGGATATKLISDALMGYAPQYFGNSMVRYASIGLIALGQSMIAGKVFRNPSVQENMLLGGLTFLTVKALQEFAPSVADQLAFSLKGMGYLSPSISSALIPSSNSMTSFIAQGAPAAARIGRLN